MTIHAPARFLPDEPLPAYAYTPGRDPHPVRDPQGHSYGMHAPAPPAPDPARWKDSRDYLRGLDLFNAGYYWEAHESWEGLWNACGRTGPTATFLQALIALAAAGVKLREGNDAGTKAHAERAAQLLGLLDPPRHMGLDLVPLADLASQIPRRTAGAEPHVLAFFLAPAG